MFRSWQQDERMNFDQEVGLRLSVFMVLELSAQTFQARLKAVTHISVILNNQHQKIKGESTSQYIFNNIFNRPRFWAIPGRP